MTESIPPFAPLSLPPLASLDSTLGPIAKKILASDATSPLRTMAAKGVAPGLKPSEAIVLLTLLAGRAEPGFEASFELAQSTLRDLPQALFQAAISDGTLPMLALHALGESNAKNEERAATILRHPNLGSTTVIAMARISSEAVSELIALNEERLLAHPRIIEALYRNRATRMSTADRIMELAARNKIELTGIAAYREIVAAIAGQLIVEPGERSFDDDQFFEHVAKSDAEEEAAVQDTHVTNPMTGQEEPIAKQKEAVKRFEDQSISARIRIATTGKSGDRMKAVRDKNPLVRQAAAKAEALSYDEAYLIVCNYNMGDDVLRIIGNNRTFTEKHAIRVKLVLNPRTPLATSSRFLPFLRENELKMVAGSKGVKGDLAAAARQQLAKKKH
jgi:hypothetical protein